MPRIEDNVKIAYHVANKFTPTVMVDEDDLKQTALWGLHKATKSFKEEKGKFSTFAYRIIRNEIIKELKKWQHKEALSLDEMEIEVKDNKQDEGFLLEEIKEILDKMELKIILLTMEGYNQRQIGSQIGKSQRVVSKVFIRAKDKIRRILENGNSA